MRPPATLKTRPDTPVERPDPSHTTSGAMFSGAMASNSSGLRAAARWPMPRFSVMRVSAPGAMAFTRTP
jgi:hypothetical protein